MIIHDLENNNLQKISQRDKEIKNMAKILRHMEDVLCSIKTELNSIRSERKKTWRYYI